VGKQYQTRDAEASMAGLVVPDEVTVALAEIAESAKEGLLALAVGAGLQVMQTLMEESVVALAGSKSKHDPDRVAVRHGHEQGSVTLGGRRVPVQRPRVRAADGSGELPVAAYQLFSGTELLGRLALERMLHGLSTRRYPVGLEPVGAQVATGRHGHLEVGGLPTVCRHDPQRPGRAAGRGSVHPRPGLAAGRRRPLRRAHLRGRPRHRPGRDQAPAGAGGGGHRERHLARELLVGLRERGLEVTRPILVVIDGAKALRRAVLDVFDHPVIGRCQQHKIRNVRDKLPERLGGPVEHRMRTAYHAASALDAQAQLLTLARELDKTHPGAAASLREGLPETLTVLRLGVPPTLARTLRSTNTIESMISICREHAGNVKRWQDGQMALRWCAAGMIEAAKQFRRVNGYRHLPALRAALEAEVANTVTGPCKDQEEVEAA
jgi:putative transposase